MMDISYFFEFNMVCKHSNFSEASKELRIAQPVLSRHIHSIEAEFGITLFERNTSPMELTPIGEVFLEESCRVINQYFKLKDVVLSAKKAKVTTVRIGGLIGSICSDCIYKGKAILKREYPGIHPKLCDAGYQTTFDSIRNHKIDVGFEPYSEMADTDDLSNIPIAKEQAYLIVERDRYPIECTELVFEDIERLNFVTARDNSDFALRKHIQSACLRRRLPGSIPNEFVLRHGTDRWSILLEGLEGMVMALPGSLINAHHPAFKERYRAIPIMDDDLYYDFRAFWLNDASKETAQYIEIIKSITESLETIR